MAQSCENLPTCGFFKKYFHVNRSACRAFISDYCRGDQRDACERKVWRQQHGEAPPDDMMPNGVVVP